MDDEVLREQIAYYRARAGEYDATSYGALRGDGDGSVEEPPHPDLIAALHALQALGPFDRILELACGTGIWTRYLSRMGRSVTALDASPEMLELNRQRVGDAPVTYQCVDLFAWEPEQTYDLVFFAFWLSHVPPAALDHFLDKVGRAVRPGGQVFILDEPAGTGAEVAAPGAALYQPRALLDGREFTIVKVYYDPAAIAQKLAARGFTRIGGHTTDTFFYLYGTRG
jgi:demethylmenaquinone methyltransferase/2-methoxy-6-polyprenyl-1,4-benzoquinol methylase